MVGFAQIIIPHHKFSLGRADLGDVVFADKSRAAYHQIPATSRCLVEFVVQLTDTDTYEFSPTVTQGHFAESRLSLVDRCVYDGGYVHCFLLIENTFIVMWFCRSMINYWFLGKAFPIGSGAQQHLPPVG